MKIYGLNKIHDIKLLGEQEFKTEKEKHDFFKSFRKSYKYIVCVNSRDVYDAYTVDADYYKRAEGGKEYEFCIEVPKSISKIDWSGL